jgi:hypothetical protein
VLSEQILIVVKGTAYFVSTLRTYFVALLLSHPSFVVEWQRMGLRLAAFHLAPSINPAEAIERATRKSRTYRYPSVTASLNQMYFPGNQLAKKKHLFTTVVLLVFILAAPSFVIDQSNHPCITTTVYAEPIPLAPSPAYLERPLSDLSPDAQAFLESRSGKPGVAVIVPDHRTIYTYNGDEPSPMASVAKVAIMLTTMNRAVQEGRDLTDWEIQLLGPMITESDNDSADILWDEIGGGPAVEAYMRAIGIIDIAPNQSYAWGTSRASAKAMALLLAQLAFGDILTRPLREMAISLLSDVTPSQRWGITAGTASEPPVGTIIGLKDGWYPARNAWWVNSVGILIPSDTKPAYTIAILTRGQPTMEYGVETIEVAAQAIHHALHLRPLPSDYP